MHYYPSSMFPSICPLCEIEIPECSTVSDKTLRQHLSEVHGRTLKKFMPVPDEPSAPEVEDSDAPIPCDRSRSALSVCHH